MKSNLLKKLIAIREEQKARLLERLNEEHLGINLIIEEEVNRAFDKFIKVITSKGKK